MPPFPNAPVSDAPLPENADALARLQAAIDGLQQPQTQATAELPETAAAISGKYYDFAFTPFYSGWRQFSWKQMALAFEPGASEAALRLKQPDGSGAELAVGLDGVPRMTELPGFGVLYIEGNWTAPDTILLDVQVLGLPETFSLLTSFTDNEMRITFSERLSGDSHALVGKLGG